VKGNGLELAARDDAFPTTGALLAFRIAWLGADLPISLVAPSASERLGRKFTAILHALRVG
jgi:hypothetical protein